MDIESLKDKLEATDYEALTQHVAALAEKAEKAVSESINGRKTLKSENERLKTLNAAIMEKLGIAEAEELDGLPDLKGQAEAAKQYEAKVRRLERELAERSEMLQTISAQRRADQQSAMLAKALQAHDWSDSEVVEQFVAARITWEDDTPFYKADGGKLVSVDEGVTLLANAKPALLKSRGAGGSGYSKNAPGANNEPQAPNLDVGAIYAARQPQPA
jgi:hypothetical protein